MEASDLHYCNRRPVIASIAKLPEILLLIAYGTLD